MSDQTTARAPRVGYYGCWNEAGYYLHDETGNSVRSFGPFVPDCLDGVLLKRGHRIPGQVDLVRFKDWTVIAFVDNTVDDRPGSNSVFIVEGYGLTAEQCWREAERVFPHIVARVKGTVRHN